MEYQKRRQTPQRKRYKQTKNNNSKSIANWNWVRITEVIVSMDYSSSSKVYILQCYFVFKCTIASIYPWNEYGLNRERTSFYAHIISGSFGRLLHFQRHKLTKWNWSKRRDAVEMCTIEMNEKKNNKQTNHTLFINWREAFKRAKHTHDK